MGNPKGPKAERDVREYLRERGVLVVKPHQEGFVDFGDLHAGDFVLQVKDWRDWQSAIREGLDGAVRQAEAWSSVRARAGAAPVHGAAVVKRARRRPADWYLVQRFGDFVDLSLLA